MHDMVEPMRKALSWYSHDWTVFVGHVQTSPFVNLIGPLVLKTNVLENGILVIEGRCHLIGLLISLCKAKLLRHKLSIALLLTKLLLLVNVRGRQINNQLKVTPMQKCHPIISNTLLKFSKNRFDPLFMRTWFQVLSACWITWINDQTYSRHSKSYKCQREWTSPAILSINDIFTSYVNPFI